LALLLVLSEPLSFASVSSDKASISSSRDKLPSDSPEEGVRYRAFLVGGESEEKTRFCMRSVRSEDEAFSEISALDLFVALTLDSDALLRGTTDDADSDSSDEVTN